MVPNWVYFGQGEDLKLTTELSEKVQNSRNQAIKNGLRWLKTVSSTNISMGYCNHSLSLNATIMVSKHCPIIGEHVVVFSITQ